MEAPEDDYCAAAVHNFLCVRCQKAAEFRLGSAAACHSSDSSLGTRSTNGLDRSSKGAGNLLSGCSIDAPKRSPRWGNNGGRDWRGGRQPLHSINFITAHDGFPLADLVCYNEKHNEANDEGNRRALFKKISSVAFHVALSGAVYGLVADSKACSRSMFDAFPQLKALEVTTAETVW